MFHTIYRVFKFMLVFCLVATTISYASTTTQQPAPIQQSAGQITNPASENCIKHGGTLVIQKHNDGGEYGVCTFQDNRQCEEWAMFRGECPVGGIKITGYITPAAQFCAITEGKYQVTGNSNTDKEQGVCIFNNGKTCDVWDYYAGKCNPNIVEGQSAYNDPFAYCAAIGTIDTPDSQYNGVKITNSIIQSMIRQGIVSADAPMEFQQNMVWRCMNHKVWVCQFGANIPCMEKADISQTPTSGMLDYCSTNPTADNIPAYVTGRATVYEWRCKNGKPEMAKQLFTIDPQGYPTVYWYELTPK